MTVALLLQIALVSPTLSAGETISGSAYVIDGDTIDISGTRIRIDGIDALETRQMCKSVDGQDYPCGQQATDVLRRALKGRRVTCQILDVDRYGRYIARCFTGNADIGETLVSAGIAFAYRKYLMRYVPAEDRARADERGFWQGSFEYPWDWRKRH